MTGCWGRSPTHACLISQFNSWLSCLWFRRDGCPSILGFSNSEAEAEADQVAGTHGEDMKL